MDGQDFVKIIKKVVRDTAINNTLSNIEHPPGRSPEKNLREKAEWYKSLNQKERNILKDVISSSVDGAIFGFLCVLDGVRSIEDGNDKGKLELKYIKEDSVIINGDGQMLHNLYNLR